MSPADPIWFKLLQLLLPGAIAGAAAIAGVVIANSFARTRALQEFHDRELERHYRMLGSLFTPVFGAYSALYSALVSCQDALAVYARSHDMSDLPSLARFERTLRENAMWLTPAAGAVLFDTASELRGSLEHPLGDVSHIVSMITQSQQAIRADLGVERFHVLWTHILTKEDQ